MRSTYTPVKKFGPEENQLSGEYACILSSGPNYGQIAGSGASPYSIRISTYKDSEAKEIRQV
jgi:hypothetical protein